MIAVAKRFARGAILGGVALLALGSEGCQRPSGSRDTGGSGTGVLATFDLKASVPEESAGDALGFAPAARNEFHHLISRLERARKDKNVRGVFVRFNMTNVGLARAEELGRVLEAVKKEKPVYCHAHELTNATYMAAARGCTNIALSPSGGVEAVGLAMEMVYLHKLLVDELKIDVDMIQIGKYKGAEEWATRDSPSPEVREYITALLGDMRASWLAASKRVDVDDAAWAKLMQDGPYGAKDAVQKKLVDRVGYEQDQIAELALKANTKKQEAYFGTKSSLDESDELGDLLRAASGSDGPRGPVALVVASGAIGMTTSGGIGGSTAGISEAEHGKLFRSLAKDDRVKAVVLRLDSPGGSALASDLIWRAMMDIRDKKPLVISVGGMAASGGYYMASAGTYVFAEKTSILGSIGVVGGKLAIGRAVERFGVHAEAIVAEKDDPVAQRRARSNSQFAPWDDVTRERLRQLMAETYALFLQRIAEGRKISVDKVEPHAEGRLFTGRSALERGLVDGTGGLGAAIDKARELAHLAPDARVYRATHRKTLLDALSGGNSKDDDERASLLAAGAARAAQSAAVGAELGPLSDSVRAVLPFIDAAAPLVHGERVLCTSPFALTIQ